MITLCLISVTAASALSYWVGCKRGVTLGKRENEDLAQFALDERDAKCALMDEALDQAREQAFVHGMLVGWMNRPDVRGGRANEWRLAGKN